MRIKVSRLLLVAGTSVSLYRSSGGRTRRQDNSRSADGKGQRRRRIAKPFHRRSDLFQGSDHHHRRGIRRVPVHRRYQACRQSLGQHHDRPVRLQWRFAVQEAGPFRRQGFFPLDQREQFLLRLQDRNADRRHGDPGNSAGHHRTRWPHACPPDQRKSAVLLGLTLPVPQPGLRLCRRFPRERVEDRTGFIGLLAAEPSRRDLPVPGSTRVGSHPD